MLIIVQGELDPKACWRSKRRFFQRSAQCCPGCCFGVCYLSTELAMKQQKTAHPYKNSIGRNLFGNCPLFCPHSKQEGNLRCQDMGGSFNQFFPLFLKLCNDPFCLIVTVAQLQLICQTYNLSLTFTIPQQPCARSVSNFKNQ